MSDMGDESYLEVDRLDRRRCARRAVTNYQPMTEPEQRDYAEALIHWASTRVEGWDIVLQVDRLTDRATGQIDEADQKVVADLISKARVSVHFD